MKTKDKLPQSLHQISEDKRFSISQFFKRAEPKTVYWYKLRDEDEDPLWVLNKEHSESDEQVKSIVRGMVNTIDFLLLSDELERLGFGVQ